MTASYTKLKSGEWGIRVEGKVQKGQTITVKKKDGSTKQEKITTIVWTDGKISLCAITQQVPSKYPSRTGGRRTGCSCGSIDGEPRDSDCWTCKHDS